MQMTNDERIAYEWAIKQQFQSVAARYARTLAKYIKRSGVGDAAISRQSDGQAENPPRR